MGRHQRSDPAARPHHRPRLYCIWLKPFNLSPLRDGGYDVTDHHTVDPRVGNLGDCVAFMEKAQSRGVGSLHRTGGQPHFDRSPLVRLSRLVP